MNANQLYEHLEKDFIKPNLSDEWSEYMGSVSDFLCENFKKRSMGLVCDFAVEINKVYTAVFPSNGVMQNILDKNDTDVMLFIHHPSIWDIRKSPNVFQQMDRDLLKQFQTRKISIYNLHVPLDNFGEYSTSVSFAKALEIKPEKSYAHYYGALCGVLGKSELSTVHELKTRLESAIGHEASLYRYGDDNIKNGIVAVVAGGGNNIEILDEIAKAGVNTFVTGITIKNDHSKNAHEYAEQNGINILGGTHYSTEKFACIAMCEYFRKNGLPSEFVNDEPVLEDM
jgi:putative NIF3 family GTP cyclohydrolase 1 type 2